MGGSDALIELDACRCSIELAVSARCASPPLSALSRRPSDQVVSVPGERKRVLELAVLRGECDSASRRAALPLETGIVIGGC